jgi:hypothetical protein
MCALLGTASTTRRQFCLTLERYQGVVVARQVGRVALSLRTTGRLKKSESIALSAACARPREICIRTVSLTPAYIRHGGMEMLAYQARRSLAPRIQSSVSLGTTVRICSQTHALLGNAPAAMVLARVFVATSRYDCPPCGCRDRSRIPRLRSAIHRVKSPVAHSE